MIRKYAEIFCWKNVSSFCIVKAKATHIFSAKNIRILCIETTKTVNEMTLNALVKLTTLWTTGPWWVLLIMCSVMASGKMGIHTILFLFLHENICCGYSLEVPGYVYNICFLGQKRKMSVLFSEAVNVNLFDIFLRSGDYSLWLMTYHIARYHIYPKYLDLYALANNVDPDQGQCKPRSEFALFAI